MEVIGIVEWWNDGMMGSENKYPIFQSSSLPTFQIPS
jgi:hypothetical protein